VEELRLKIDLKYRVTEHGLVLSGLEQGQVLGSCEHGSEAAACIKYREFVA
jgi:hypothetical protein